MTRTASLGHRFRRGFDRFVLRLLARPRHRGPLVRLGSDYGGWWVPADLAAANWACCCAGVGEDVTFDLALVDRFGCRVLTVDPTPTAIQHVAMLRTPPAFTFAPFGLGGSARVARFYAPADPSHVSHSIVAEHGRTCSFEARLITLDDAAELASVDRFDLVKLDIEGAYHEVIESLRERNAPAVLLVEFDLPASWTANRSSLRRLRGLGYRVVKVERLNITLVRVDG